MRHKKLSALFAAVVAVISLSALGACTDGKRPEPKPQPEPDTATLSALAAVGNRVVNEKNDAIYLRGVNAGGLFVTEHWMTGFVYGSTPSNDYRSLTQTFIARFGEQKTQELWAEYRNNWWMDADFKLCADMGVNCIRLPFTYMNVDFPAVRDNDYADAGKTYDFTALDAFVEKAAEHGIYTILDLHGAYGSHNGQDHSGQIFESASDVTFYSDERMIDLTVKLWSALSEHYKNEPAVAGYDILNEPGEKAGLTSERHFKVYDRIYKAIRATGDKHIVIFESCWDAKDLPMPDEYGWSNCMYSFHHYAESTFDAAAHGTDWNDKMRLADVRFKDVPLYMGEFTNYTSTEKWEYVLDLLNRSNWHWTSWTYKVWGNMPWGIVNIRGNNASKVNASADGYDDIIGKFKLLRSDSEVAKKYTFGEHGGSLEQLFKAYATAPHGSTPDAGEYMFYTDDGWLGTGFVSGNETVKLTADRNAAKPLRITFYADGSNVATLSLGGKALYVSNGAVVCGAAQNELAAMFYPVSVDGGIAFVSYSACKYLRLNADGALVADAVNVKNATVFSAE